MVKPKKTQNIRPTRRSSRIMMQETQRNLSEKKENLSNTKNRCVAESQLLSRKLTMRNTRSSGRLLSSKQPPNRKQTIKKTDFTVLNGERDGSNAFSHLPSTSTSNESSAFTQNSVENSYSNAIAEPEINCINNMYINHSLENIIPRDTNIANNTGIIDLTVDDTTPTITPQSLGNRFISNETNNTHTSMPSATLNYIDTNISCETNNNTENNTDIKLKILNIMNDIIIYQIYDKLRYTMIYNKNCAGLGKMLLSGKVKYIIVKQLLSYLTDYLNDLKRIKYKKDTINNIRKMICKFNQNSSSSSNSQNGNAPLNDSQYLHNTHCPICLQDVQIKDIAATICGHVFCITCLQTSIQQTSQKCPLCRKFIGNNGYYRLINEQSPSDEV